nr:MAG TPA: tail protein [Caudoviricetes sp.]
MPLNEIRYKGAAYAVDGDIWTSSGSWYETKSLKCDSLEANSFEVTVSDSDRAITSFRKNDKVEYFRDGRRMGIFYLQTVERVGPNSYHLSGLSAVGLLMTRQHNGGIYTGQTAGEVIRDICGDIPVKVESVYESRKLYGWLPYVQPSQSSARDNLAEVLFAIGAWLGVDNDGVLRVEKLWDGTASAIGPGLIHAEGCSVQYTDAVSAVEITEHQWVPSSDAVTLFEGTTEQGALIVFDDPAHDLTADGFTILESGANYAVVSAGSGTLTGQGYTHITRIIRKTVAEDAEENVVAITDAHLVSLTNSIDVANRTADYYRHRETIQVDINPLSGPPGNVMQIYHPWDKVMVSACIAERETTISGLLKSGIQALVGFTPPQPDASEYFDERVVLTGSGTWTPPEGASEIRAVLIGGGSDGGAGQDGTKTRAVLPDDEDYTSKQYKITQNTTTTDTSQSSITSTPKTSGGAGGNAGPGGKILSVNISIQPGQEFEYSAGEANGGESTFGNFSSASGERSSSGYFDPTTREYFGKSGIAGTSGGDGGTPGASGGSSSGSAGGDGISGSTIKNTKTATSGQRSAEGTFTLNFGGAGGGGAGGNSGSVLGTPGSNATSPSIYPNLSVTTLSGGPTSDYGADVHSVSWGRPPEAGAGGNGANGNDGQNYGDGGDGGGGGGGVGAWSSASFSASITSTFPFSSLPYTANVYVKTYAEYRYGTADAGTGGTGGKGKPGCIILYYRRPKKISPGPLVTSGQKWLLDSLGRRIIV